MQDKTIAVDLAKNVFEIGVSDRPGHVEETYRLSRVKFLRFFVNREPATVVMEACGSAHHWERQIRELGARGRSDLAAVGEAVRATRQDGPCGCEGII